MITHKTITVAVAGADGAAAGTGSTKVPPGKLLGISVNYVTQPATCDVTVTSTTNGVAKTLLTLTDNATDVPMRTITEPLKGATGADLADTTKSPNVGLPVVGGQIDVAVAQGNAGSVIVEMFVEH